MNSHPVISNRTWRNEVEGSNPCKTCDSRLSPALSLLTPCKSQLTGFEWCIVPFTFINVSTSKCQIKTLAPELEKALCFSSIFPLMKRGKKKLQRLSRPDVNLWVWYKHIEDVGPSCAHMNSHRFTQLSCRTDSCIICHLMEGNRTICV